MAILSVVLAQLGLKATALAQLEGALAFSKPRPGQSCHSWLGLGWAQPRPWLCIYVQPFLIVGFHFSIECLFS